ncbi:TPA: thiolase domain-containing protein [archaeon]|uniref:Thiolase domain-containing protein n=1 Tax=Candidatus Naiadarchaeum limnaeum TaxID=2756139 RepID=A0A832UZU9_9ARCH|nr:thiolase domain-containing protein [Candidatus Naiadarchaeum limnaeum]
MANFKKEVAIIGIGLTQFGELWDKSFRSLIAEAGNKAIIDAEIKPDQIDGLFGGNMSGGLFIKQEHLASLAMDHGALLPMPAMRIESACSSGGQALRAGYMAIKSGLHEVVVAGGVEKMTDVLTGPTTEALATAADQEWEAFYGVTFPGEYALIARRHMNDYGTTEEQMAQVAVKNHYNGARNPNAQYQKEITLETVMKSTKVADPLKLFDCSPITDGAAAVILASAENAKEFCDNPIWLVGSGAATDTLALHDRDDLTTLKATVVAAQSAYKHAGVTQKDIDMAEVHDCFTIAEICAIEDLGFCKKGEGGKFTEQGHTSLTGDIPINTSGGLKSKGHPVGATGIAQAVEIVLQLRGDAGKRQVKNAEIGLTHNVGGSGGSCAVHIFSR